MKIHPEIRALMALASGDGDVWGFAMSHSFAISENLYAYGEDIPAEWQFRDPWPADYRRAEIEDDDENTGRHWPDCEYSSLYRAGEITGDDLRHAGNVLSRYCRRLVWAGKDY